MADAGFLGITMPEELGGSGLGVTEAAIMMHTVTQHGGGMAAASSIHINLFGPHPIVVHGTTEQKTTLAAAADRGREQGGFGVTEPNAGLDTTSIETFATRTKERLRHPRPQDVDDDGAGRRQDPACSTRTTPKEDCKRPTDGMTLFYTDLDRSKIEVRRIPKMGRAAVDSNAVFIDDLAVPEKDRIGEEGKGFRYLLDSLNPERILFGVEAVGLGRDALRRAAAIREGARRVRPADRPEPGHPASAGGELGCISKAPFGCACARPALYDSKQPCGAEANAAKFLGARAAFDAATQAVMTHGGMGYAKEYQVERLFRESVLTAHRAGDRAAHPFVHRRKRARSAEIVLSKMRLNPRPSPRGFPSCPQAPDRRPSSSPERSLC